MDKRSIGMNIKQARKEKHLKQKDLAKLIGFSESSISKYEQGLIQIPQGVLERIAKVLEVSPFDLTADVEQIRSDVSLIESVSKVYGSEAPVLLNNFDKLNQTGKKKACEYVSDLADQEKYCTKEKEPSSAATDTGSEG